MLNEYTSGGASVNDAFFHGSISTLAFGGVGSSGTGAYHGQASFECFTHRRSVTTTPGWIEKMLDVRYPPYGDAKLKRYRMSSQLKPNFDRNGVEIKGLRYWIGFLMSAGTGSKKSGLLAWALVAVLAWADAKKRADSGTSLISSWFK